MQIRNATLEMSLKPFKSVEEKYVRETCREIFRQWLPLAQRADMVSVLLWTADGSEILDYKGDPDEEIEWARYIGGANPRAVVPNDPEKKALHSRSYLYMENPPVITYRDLARIVRTLKEVGREVTGKPVRVGATFDPGPEFARSPFKYERHNEVCFAGTMGKGSFVCCYATLNGDTARYAGFPEGIPDGTPMGTFLGRQSRHFLTDMGMDYLWLSNGFGFGMETWKTTGALFDGERFHAEEANAIRERILNFWKLFRQECPDHPLETRGTNLSTGIDLASDAVPLQDIYNGGFNVAPPPNSPWAALNGDFGLELMGHMARISGVPGEEFPFRYYVHDPWWLNSPWLDRYGREPHDIYLPLTVARVDAAGVVRTPTAVELLTIDDSYGNTPDRCPREVLAHLLDACDFAPDAPGPVVWIYPFAEYHAMTFGAEPRIQEPFFNDWFIRAAINNGLPLNTVVTTENFLASSAANPALYRASVLLSPVPDAGSALARALAEWVRGGGKVLLYGPLDHAAPELLDLLNLRLADPIAGELDLDLRLNPDCLTAGEYPRQVIHRETMSAGAINSVLADESDPHTDVAAQVADGATARVVALSRRMPAWNGGAVAWTRGIQSSCFKGGHLLTPDDPAEWFAGDLLVRFLLTRFGLDVAACKKRPAQRNPITCVARHDNGFFFSGYVPDTRVSQRLRFPHGAPLFLGLETELVDGHSCYHHPRAWRRECRVFVDGQSEGELSCVEQISGEIGVRRRFLVTGLEGATVRFYPEGGTESGVRMLRNPAYPFLIGDFREYQVVPDGPGVYLEVRDITGSLLISW